ncbi:oxidoreductase ylbE [Gracilibacillus boraciitolerans JCM 21714]|uniref:Oxidoreductase ylbE n=1 Tax=Gracilibacillus boraciitolerans JCM 21714 TaxID=1298598 RepID=W4VK15_9BACI|nr:SDR family oxidoreductase [Gracilibacillus boraciitolerans]GAE93168.1 oxidoreductase ylbE [Gracilibacillus boraciitolerans JCM 21714]
MKILVVGANGQVGKHLVNFIQKKENMEARAMIRKEEQASYFKDLGAEVAVADLEDEIEKIAKAAEGVDAIVFTAGSGPKTGKDKTLMVDLDGAVKTIEAAKQANVKRYVMVSSFDTSREAIQSAPDAFAPYIVAKHYADEWLRASDLDYTIVHPGGLTNNPGKNQVQLGEKVDRGEIPREDVARVIIAALENNATIGKAFKAVEGNAFVEDAIKSI